MLLLASRLYNSFLSHAYAYSRFIYFSQRMECLIIYHAHLVFWCRSNHLYKQTNKVSYELCLFTSFNSLLIIQLGYSLYHRKENAPFEQVILAFMLKLCRFPSNAQFISVLFFFPLHNFILWWVLNFAFYLPYFIKLHFICVLLDAIF